MPKRGANLHGRRSGVLNKVTQDVREAIKASFSVLGGRDYLVRLARSHPAVYASLLAKVVPSELHVHATASYQALPVPVEARDAIPRRQGEIVEGEIVQSLPAPSPIDADDWLLAPVTEAVTTPK